MSAGKVHVQASVLMAAGFFVGTLFTRDVSDIEYSIGAMVGALITPDLDVDKAYIGDKYILKRFGKVPHSVWRACWHFYRRSIKHGSELSHFPVVGTVFRLAYLFFFAIVLPSYLMAFFFGIDPAAEVAWWFGKVCQHWKIVVGLTASDTHHYFMDIATVQDTFSLESLLRRKTNFKRKTL
jgi:uncharacterized metal-binding protein